MNIYIHTFVSSFEMINIPCTQSDYLGYMLTKDGIKLVQKKVQAVLDLQPPTTLKQLRSFLDMVLFYRDMWKRRSHILAPQIDHKNNSVLQRSSRSLEVSHWDKESKSSQIIRTWFMNLN